jgi:hypothetical protein
MPVILLFIFLSVGWAITGVLSIFRIKDARNTMEFLSDAQAEAQELRIEAERRAQAAETELDFLRQTVVGLTQRPAIVTLPEQHIQTFANIVQSIVHPESQVN